MSYTKGEWAVSSTTLVCNKEARIIANCTPIDVPALQIDIHEAEANARRICQCVNNFDKLLEACKKSYQAIAIASKYVRLSGSQPQRAEAQELVEIGDAIRDAAIAAAEQLGQKAKD